MPIFRYRNFLPILFLSMNPSPSSFRQAIPTHEAMPRCSGSAAVEGGATGVSKSVSGTKILRKFQSRKSAVFIAPDVTYRYLDCGDFRCGFAQVRCDNRSHEDLLAFSRKRRHPRFLKDNLLPLVPPTARSCFMCRSLSNIVENELGINTLV